VEQETGKCLNPDCSQWGLAKSLLVTKMYGYGQGATVACPECDNQLVVTLRHRSIRQRVADIFDYLAALAASMLHYLTAPDDGIATES
jgi:hypothetical protein